MLPTWSVAIRRFPRSCDSPPWHNFTPHLHRHWQTQRHKTIFIPQLRKPFFLSLKQFGKEHNKPAGLEFSLCEQMRLLAKERCHECLRVYFDGKSDMQEKSSTRFILHDTLVNSSLFLGIGALGWLYRWTPRVQPAAKKKKKRQLKKLSNAIPPECRVPLASARLSTPPLARC